MKRRFFCILMTMSIFSVIVLSCSDDDKDPALVIEASDFETTIDENPLHGQSLGTISATSNKGNVTFTIKDQDHAGAFELNETTGELTVGNESLFDFETNPQLKANVTVSKDGESKVVAITTNLTDVKTLIGNYNKEGFELESFSADYILGTKYTVTQKGILQSLNLVGNMTDAKVQMAIYSDNNNSPGNLLAVSEVGTLRAPGNKFLKVPPIVLQSGDYWVMAIYDATGEHSYQMQTTNDTKIYYKAVTFGESLPENGSDFSTYTDGAFTYFMSIE